MGKVNEAVNAFHHAIKEDNLDNNASNLSHRRTSATDSLMMDLERELFSPVSSFPEGAGFNYKDEQYIEDLNPESILETPPIDLPTVDISMCLDPPEMNYLSFTNDIPLTPSPTNTTTTYHPPHTYPPTPISSVIPQQAFNFQNLTLSPLSSGGYIFNQGNTYLPPQTPFVTPFVPSTTGSAPFTQTVTPVSSEIASRQEKLDKFRQKRTKRNYNRADKPVKRNMARDELGQFTKQPKDASPKGDVRDVKDELQKSQMESEALKSKLQIMEQELALLKRKAEQAQQSQEVAINELAQQQRVNNSLLLENRLLWSSVPSSEVFCTIKQNGSRPYLNVKPFEQKIDFSMAVQELVNTDSRILEAARAEETNYEKRWEALDFAPSGYC